MAWSGGNFTRANPTWVSDAAAGIGIEAARHDTQDNDFTTGINECLNKTGQNGMTGTLSMGSNKISNLAAGTLRNDAAQVGQVQDGTSSYLGTTAGTATAFTVTATPTITALVNGAQYVFRANAANGAAATLKIDGTAAITMQRQGTALVGNEFIANDIVTVVYNGTNFQITNIATAPLYVDRTNGRVGIGTTAPTSALQVTGAIDGIPDAAGVHIGMSGGTAYGSIELCGATGGLIDFNSPGVDVKGRIIYTNSDNAMAFTTNGAERMRVDTNGNVGIGTTAATSALTVSGPISTTNATAGVHIGVTGTTSGIELTNSSGGYIDFTNTTTDSLARIIFVPASSNNLQIRGPAAINFYTNSVENGGVDTSGYWYLGKTGNRTIALAANMYIDAASGAAYRATSSLKYKKDVRNYEKGLAEVLNLRPVSFKSKDASPYGDDFEFAGLIAEEVDAAGMTEFVQYAADSTPDGLSYGHMVALAFKAIQELNAKVEALEARIAALEA